MYRLVIVDDERDVRQRLASLIAKSGSGFELVAEYENGIDAYDGILSENPDLIITDIKIPYIDGIELAKNVREVLPLVKIIIITGFDEFDYAKQAANLGVVGFISKPLTLEDMRAILQKAEDALESEFVTAENISRLQDFYSSSLPVLREADLIRLSNLREVPPSFEKKLRFNNIDLDYRYFVFCVFDFDEAISEEESENYELAFTSIRRQIADTVAPVWHCEVFSRYDKLCLLLKSNTPPDMQELGRQLERILLRVGRYSGMPLSAGISTVAEKSKNFFRLRTEAMRALEYRKFMGGRKVFFYGAGAGSATELAPDDSAVKELAYLLRFKPLEESLAALCGIRAQLEGTDAHHAYYYTLTGILNALLKACDDPDTLCAEYAGDEGLYHRLFEFKTADDAFNWLATLMSAVRSLNDSLMVGHVERNLERVVAYMDTHFRDPDISFETMAAEVNFSVSYISALLKKYLNTTFVKYLTTLRMEAAKELLPNQALKIADVAEQLGYADPYYFSHCFKKYTGISPKEYRSHA